MIIDCHILSVRKHMRARTHTEVLEVSEVLMATKANSVRQAGCVCINVPSQVNCIHIVVCGVLTVYLQQS